MNINDGYCGVVFPVQRPGAPRLRQRMLPLQVEYNPVLSEIPLNDPFRQGVYIWTNKNLWIAILAFFSPQKRTEFEVTSYNGELSFKWKAAKSN